LGIELWAIAGYLACGGLDHLIFRRPHPPNVRESETMITHQAANEDVSIGEDVDLSLEGPQIF
jgi:hypothetical protein